jgi:predicted lipid-binding transport protein (Tim44 family)
MSSGMDPFNLILLAVAAIVVWRLWSVLGTRTGLEKPPVVLQPAPEKTKPPLADEVKEGEVLEPENREPVWKGYATDGSDAAKALDAIAQRTPGFTATSFIRGANVAYEMVLEAYAKGDKAALKPLLSKELLESFASAIDGRMAKKHTTHFQFVGIKSATIKRATLNGNKAQIEIDYSSEMISATHDASGKAIEGDDTSIRTVTDLWTFERDVASRDPNWKLVATEDNA